MPKNLGRAPPPHSGNARKKTFFFREVFPNVEHADDLHADDGADEDEADADDDGEDHLSLHLSEWRLRFGPNGVLSSVVAVYWYIFYQDEHDHNDGGNYLE